MKKEILAEWPPREEQEAPNTEEIAQLNRQPEQQDLLDGEWREREERKRKSKERKAMLEALIREGTIPQVDINQALEDVYKALDGAEHTDVHEDLGYRKRKPKEEDDYFQKRRKRRRIQQIIKKGKRILED
jgi:hypothetical protein